PAQQGPIPPMYAATSFWNQLIQANPAVDPGSDAMVAKAMVPYRASANFWAGSNSWAKPLAYANSVIPLYQLGCRKCDCVRAVSWSARREQLAQGHIDHALFFTTPYTRKDYIAWPATHTDGQHTDPAAIPQGARIQLDPDFDVEAQRWPRWEKILARALQRYG